MMKKQEKSLFLRACLSHTFLNMKAGGTVDCVRPRSAWGEEIKRALEHIEKEIVSWEEEGCDCPPNAHNDFTYQKMCALRELYCVTHMVNKYVIPLPLDCILTNLSYQDEDVIRLYDLTDEWERPDPEWETDALGYRYYPYMLKPEELSFALLCTDIRREKTSFNPGIQTTRLKNIYNDLYAL